ncbi:pyridoxal-dependent decarboxylase, exosortase A system-associated [Sphingomonas sp. 1P06PA]|uniref:pyridoxal-dependent decarboxylase, exosortase A system-associated n=1 Tax=Sphingomonas sp. 1P06PA TaxID=554121 RepID=UPI0039A40866
MSIADRWPRDAAGNLLVGGLPLEDAVALAGGTPCYLYDRARLQVRAEGLRALLPDGVQLHYAIKANPYPPLVTAMAGWVDGFDVASGGELEIALAAGMAPDRISFAGPGKSAEELARAAAAGIVINLESLREARLLAGTGAAVAIRVNPDFELKASGMRMAGGAKPFGIDEALLPEMYSAISDAGLRFEGFHIYAGSQSLRADAIIEAQTATYEAALRWANAAGVRPRHINIGGGFGIPYAPHEAPLDLEPVLANLEALAIRAARDLPGTALVIELGRWLVGEAGLYVARVRDRKVSHGQTFLVVDGGMHQHLAASGNFGQKIRRNYPVAVNGAEARREIASIVGPLCTPLDLLADRAELAMAQEGDLIAIFQSGAYGYTASPRAFLGHPDPGQALV